MYVCVCVWGGGGALAPSCVGGGVLLLSTRFRQLKCCYWTTRINLAARQREIMVVVWSHGYAEGNFGYKFASRL